MCLLFIRRLEGFSPATHERFRRTEEYTLYVRHQEILIAKIHCDRAPGDLVPINRHLECPIEGILQFEFCKRSKMSILERHRTKYTGTCYLSDTIVDAGSIPKECWIDLTIPDETRSPRSRGSATVDRLRLCVEFSLAEN
jgi:hypothetical protein